MSEHMMPIPSMIYNAAVGGHVTNSQQIIDEDYNLEQKDINKETLGVPYNASNPNGMGKIVLKKNDNFKTVVEAQTNGNTIFVIKYDFALTGNVTVPVNCVLEFDGGSINNSTGNTYTLTFPSDHSSIVIINDNHTCFNNVGIINLNGNFQTITATNIGLVKNSEITDVIKSGWINICLDFEYINNMYQSSDLSFIGGDYTVLKNWVIYRKNEAHFVVAGILEAHVINCLFDGSLCDPNYQETGTTSYDQFNALEIRNLISGSVEGCTIQNFCSSAGIWGESVNNMVIKNNKILNVRGENITGKSDTWGDGIAYRDSTYVQIIGNTVINDTNNQIGRCGIVIEYKVSGIISNNTVEGYDRGIHVEHDYEATISNNTVKRCICAYMHWGNGAGNFIIKDNYFSNEGINSNNPKHRTPLVYMMGVIDCLGSQEADPIENTPLGVNCKNTRFINNIVVYDGNARIENVANYYSLYVQHYQAPTLIGNIFKNVTSVKGYIQLSQGIVGNSGDTYLHLENNEFEAEYIQGFVAAPRYFVYGNKFVCSLLDDHNWLRSATDYESLGYSAAHYRIFENNILQYDGPELNENYSYAIFYTPCIVRGNILSALILKSGTTYGYVEKLYSDSIFDDNTIVRSQSWETALTTGNIVGDNNNISYPVGKVRFIDRIAGTMTDINVIKV